MNECNLPWIYGRAAYNRSVVNEVQYLSCSRQDNNGCCAVTCMLFGVGRCVVVLLCYGMSLCSLVAMGAATKLGLESAALEGTGDVVRSSQRQNQ